MQSPPYPEPPRRQPAPRLVLAVGGAALAVLVAAAVIVVLATAHHSAGGTLKGPLLIREVLDVTTAACPEGDTTRVPSVTAGACYRLGDGMTVTKARSVKLVSPDPARGSTAFTVQVELLSADARRFGTLTARLARQQPPRNALAIVVAGKVVSAPMVREPITGGAMIIDGNFTRAQAQRYVDLLRD